MLARLKTPLTLVVLVLLVAGALVVGVRLATQEIPALGGSPDDSACETQTIPAGDRLRSTQVIVNVYNAGTVAGLAEETQAALVERGFLPGTAGNAPEDVRTREILILDPDPRSAAVQLVKRSLEPPVGVRQVDEDLAEGVDVVVGDDAGKVRTSGPAAITVDEATEVCVPAPPTS